MQSSNALPETDGSSTLLTPRRHLDSGAACMCTSCRVDLSPLSVQQAGFASSSLSDDCFVELWQLLTSPNTLTEDKSVSCQAGTTSRHIPSQADTGRRPGAPCHSPNHATTSAHQAAPGRRQSVSVKITNTTYLRRLHVPKKLMRLLKVTPKSHSVERTGVCYHRVDLLDSCGVAWEAWVETRLRNDDRVWMGCLTQGWAYFCQHHDVRLHDRLQFVAGKRNAAVQVIVRRG